MTSNQTMNYYVWPRHLYSNSRTCTCSNFCRRLSRLVAFHICYLLDYAGVHGISVLMTWFQCMLDIFSHYGDLDPWYIFSFHGNLGPLYIFIMEILIYCMLYVVMTTHVIVCKPWLFMAIVLLCVWDYYMYLQSCAEFDYCIIILDCWFFHLVLHHSTSGVTCPNFAKIVLSYLILFQDNMLNFMLSCN